MVARDLAIVACAHTKFARRSGRSPFAIAGELLEQILNRTGLDKRDIDGLAIAPALAEASNPFWSNFMIDYLGLTANWLQTTDLGGATALANVARAGAAIRAGLCETVLILGADAAMVETHSTYSGYRSEWEQVQGLPGPPGEFGMLMHRYMHVHRLDPEALAKVAVSQRAGAVLNENAYDGFRKPMSREDYFASRMIADPIRLLDCVMPLDGGVALVMMSSENARRRGFRKAAHPTGYAEITNIHADDPLADILETGHAIVGPKAMEAAGLRPLDIRVLHPYDDFTFAVLMQLEQMGFCARGGGSRFILETDIHFSGDLPINPGGGQLSMGQPGLAGGFVNLAEAVIQILGEAGERQVRDNRNALVAGIGMIPLLRNWGTSNALVLEASA
jgi:acetyl-CoA acetyltransferase